jgi:anti-sigma factor RsiW
MKDFEQHCSEESFESYAMGRLDDPRTEVLEEHLLLCEPCRNRLVETEQYIKAMKAASARLRKEAQAAPESAFNRIKSWFAIPTVAWAAAAAALVLVVFASGTFLRQNGSNASPVAVALTAVRGGAVTTTANHPLDLTLDARGLELTNSATVEVVNANGATVEKATAIVSGDSATAHLGKLRAGAYFVRLFKTGSTEPVREYALQAQNR